MERIPFYAKTSLIILGIVGFFFILCIGQGILVPLVFSLILAILLNPVVNFFVRKGMNRLIAISFSIMLMTLFVAGIFYFIGSQIAMFSEAFPELERKFSALYKEVVAWISGKVHMPRSKILNIVETKKSEGMDQAGSIVGSTLVTLTNVLVIVFLIPVYVFLFLFYKPLLLEFVGKLFKHEKHSTVGEILFITKSLIQSYLLGLMIELLIVAVLNSMTLLIIGVDYAIILGVIGAILNLIPYLGGIVAISLPMIMAMLTGSPGSVFFVFIGYIIVQIIDNNFLVPVIVASKVKVNALVSIVVVLIGGALWGVAGMFLSIPVTAIVKVVCDHIESLKPLGFLIGDTMPSISRDIFKFSILEKAAAKEKEKLKMSLKLKKNPSA